MMIRAEEVKSSRILVRESVKLLVLVGSILPPGGRFGTGTRKRGELCGEGPENSIIGHTAAGLVVL